MNKASITTIFRGLMLGFAIIGFSFVADAQATKKASPATKAAQVQLKEHSCTQACHDSGKHVYAHGEKGHVCGKECKKAAVAETGKEHVCTSACKDEKHVYAHGEKGHVCTDACKKS